MEYRSPDCPRGVLPPADGSPGPGHVLGTVGFPVPGPVLGPHLTCLSKVSEGGCLPSDFAGTSA